MAPRTKTSVGGLSAARRKRRSAAEPTKPLERQRREREIRATVVRTAILEAARSLYAKGGYAAVTMRAIGDQLGFAAPSLYHHFVSKEEIFRALQAKTAEMLLDAELKPAAVDPLEDLRLFFWRYYEFSKDHPDYFALLYADQSAPPFEEGPSRTIEILGMRSAARVQRCVLAGYFPQNLDTKRAGSALWGAVHGPAALRLIHRRDLGEFDQMAADNLDLTIAGLRIGTLALRGDDGVAAKKAPTA